MRTALIASALALASTVAHADWYTTPDTSNPSLTITAGMTGELYGIYLGPAYGYAKGEDQIEMLDLATGKAYGLIGDNYQMSAGATLDFGAVNVGDTLAFNIFNSQDIQHPGTVDSTDAALSSDSVSDAHLSMTAIGNAVLSFEDLSGIYGNDRSYDDYIVAFSGCDVQVTSSPVPEPTSLALLGTGLLGAVGVMKRRFQV